MLSNPPMIHILIHEEWHNWKSQDAFLNDFILHNSGVQLHIKEIELKTTVAVTWGWLYHGVSRAEQTPWMIILRKGLTLIKPNIHNII